MSEASGRATVPRVKALKPKPRKASPEGGESSLGKKYWLAVQCESQDCRLDHVGYAHMLKKAGKSLSSKLGAYGQSGHILALSFKQKSSKPFKFSPLRS